MITFGNNNIVEELLWTEFKAIAITSKNLSIQYDESSTEYTIFAVDSLIVYKTKIYKGNVPSNSSYSQGTNDTDKAEFEATYKTPANKSAVNRVVLRNSTDTADFGSSSTPFSITGAKTNDNAAPGATNIGVLSAVATSAAPSYTTGNQVALSTDLAGALRITGSISATNPSVSSTGATVPTSATLSGGSVTTAAPSYTTGQMSALSLTTGGLLRTDGSGVTQPVSGTITANIGTSGSLALDATLTGGTQTTKIVNGANTAAVKAASTAAVATDPALVVAISPNNTVPVSLTSTTITGTVAATQSGTWTVQPGNTANTTAWKVDGSAVTQPVSGTVTSNIGTTNGLALDATLSRAQGSTTSGQTGPLIQGAVTTAAPSYSTAQTSPLSLTTGGLLRIDGSGVTQPISASSLPLPTGASTAAKQPALGTAGSASTDVITVQGIASMTALKVDGSAVTQPVSGTVTANAGSGTFTISGTVTANAGTNLNTSTLATETSLAKLTQTQGSTTSGQSGTLIQGAVTTAAPSYTTAQTSPISLTTGGLLRVDGSGVTQPVSGTVTATNPSVGTNTSAIPGSSTQIGGSDGTNLQALRAFDADTGGGTQYVLGTVLRKSASGGSVEAGTSSDPLRTDPTGTTTQPVSGTVTANQGGTWNITNVSGTVSLPTGAATAAKQPALGTAGSASADVITVQGIASMTALKVDGSAVTQPVSGTVTANIGTSGSLALDATLSAQSLVDNAAFTDGTSRVVPSGYILDEVAGTALTENDIGAARIDSKRAIVHVIEDSSTRGQRLTVSAAGAAKVDGSAVTQPVSGTVTANAGSGTFTVSGTVTANAGTNLNTSALATETTLAKLTQTQGSTTSGQSGTLIQGAVTTAAPSYTTAQTSPLSLTTGGLLRVDGSGVTQPVSGTVTANQGGTWNITNVSGTVSLPTGASTAAKQPALGTAGSASADVLTVQGIASMTALKVDGSAVTQPVSGTITANIGTSGSLALDATLTGGTAKSIVRGGVKGSTTAADVTSTASGANHQLIDVAMYDASGNQITTFGGGQQYADGVARGTATGTLMMVDDGTNIQSASGDTAGKLNVNATQAGTWNINNVSGTVSLPTGASTEASLAKLTVAQSAALGSNTQAMVGGSVTTAAPSYTTGNINPLSLTTAGLLRVDGSGVTQPVSGTVTANIGTSGSLALDATVAKLTVAQSAALGSNTQAMVGGSVTTAAPSYTTGNINPFSLTTAGALRTQDASAVTQGSTTSGQTGQLMQGAVTTAAPSYTTAQTSPFSLTTAGLLRTESRVGDGTNAVAVKAASTAAVTADPALVVRIPSVATSVSIPATISPVLVGGSDDNGQAQFVKVDTTGHLYSVPLASQQYAQFQQTLTASGNAIATNISGGQIGIIIDCPTVTGTTPQMVITCQDVAPNDNTRVCGPVTTIATITAAGTYEGVANTLSNAVRIAWTITGTTPSFTTTTISTVTHISEGTTQDLGGSGTIAAVNAAVTINTESMSIAGITITGSWVATLIFEGSTDNTNWNSIQGGNPVTLASPSSTTVNGTFLIDCAGYSQVRVKCSAYTSGTATVQYLTTQSFGTPLRTIDTQGATTVTNRKVATYMGATATFTPAAAATDIFYISGSATKTIKVLRIDLSGVQTTAGNINTITLVKRSTANTAGTPVTTTRVPTDSNYAAATATVQHYTANPTTGTLVGTIYAPRMFLPQTSSTLKPATIFEFDVRQIGIGDAIVLRGTAEGLAINMGGGALPTGAATFQVDVMWTEE